MKIGTITLNNQVEKTELEKIKQVNNLDVLFIQYKENELYNINRNIEVIGDIQDNILTDSFLVCSIDGINILAINSSNEDETWDILDEHLKEETDVLLGFFNEDADSNTHFELTFDFVDSYKELCHEEEKYPAFTDIISQTRDTWILATKKHPSDVFELDKLTNGVWIDVRD